MTCTTYKKDEKRQAGFVPPTQKEIKKLNKQMSSERRKLGLKLGKWGKKHKK